MDIEGWSGGKEGSIIGVEDGELVDLLGVIKRVG